MQGFSTESVYSEFNKLQEWDSSRDQLSFPLFQMVFRVWQIGSFITSHIFSLPSGHEIV
jgi:hypothetical protein